VRFFAVSDCVTTHNGTQTQYTTTEINHSVRSWQWQLCTELGWFQDGPPLGQPTIATRLVTPSDDLVRRTHVAAMHRLTRVLIAARVLVLLPGAIREDGPRPAGRRTHELAVQGLEHAHTAHLLRQRAQYVAPGSPSGPRSDRRAPGDPWKEVTVASDFHRYPNTTAHPVGIAPNGFHTSDLIIEEGVSDAGVLAVQQLGFASMARWIAEFKPRQKPRRGA
jgi:hypothetical protein